MPPEFPIIGVYDVVRCPTAANDNPPPSQEQDFRSRALLREALRQFAAHGAGAAEHARVNAEQAFFAGRQRNYLHWMAICRTLDRRMVDADPSFRSSPWR
jgi:hypothetical protein